MDFWRDKSQQVEQEGVIIEVEFSPGPGREINHLRRGRSFGEGQARA